MTKTIKLINSKDGWLARFENNERVIKLFGTDTIPTPFNELASPMMVLNAIKERNPKYNVILA